MLTFDDVYHAPLGRLKAAADRWAETKGRLDRLAEDARRTMAAKARAEDWRGVNAEVTKPFIDKTAKEFADAARAAEGIHKVLADGYDAFRKARTELTTIVDTDAPRQGLVVRSDGVVEAAFSLERSAVADHDRDRAEAVRKQRADIAALQRRLDAVIETCDDADVACANALRANITGDRHQFSAPTYASLDAEEAQRALDLARKGQALSHEELGRLNELLGDNSGSKEFARSFYGALGPRGALEFFGRLSTDTFDGARVDEQRLKDVQELQKNLGLQLATATRGGDAWTQHWSAEMRRLGTERVPLSPYDTSPPFGYQLLGGILRYGSYDPRFLVPVAEHVTQLHAKDPFLFANSRPLTPGWLQNPYNPSGLTGAGFDPMVPVLEALGHSPEAAKQFFSAEPTAYGRDGTAGGALDLGKSKDGEEIGSYLDFFLNETYESFPDVDGHDPALAKSAADHMPDALGHALEAATLGHAWDDPRPELRRDATTARIMADVVETYGGDAELLKKHHSALADSLGTMAAGYVDDLNWALAKNGSTSPFAPAGDAAAHPEFGRTAAVGFLSTLGQHPDAYATLSTAERLHTTSVLEAQVGPDGRIDEARAREAVRTGASLQGVLDEARARQVEAEGMKLHEDFEKAQAKKAAWVEFGTGAAIAAGVAFLPATAAAAGAAAVVVPLAVDTGTGAMETLAGQVVGDWSDKAVEDHKDATEDRIHEDGKAVYEAGRYGAEAPMERFVGAHRSRVSGDFRQDLVESVDGGTPRATPSRGRPATPRRRVDQVRRNPGPRRGRLLGTGAWVLAACLLLAACGDGDEPEERRVTAARQCDDTLSPAAARALETVLRTRVFDHDPRGGLERVTAQLTEDHARGGLRSRGRLLCRADAADSPNRVEIRFGRYDDSDLIADAHPVGLHPYDLGREAFAGPTAAYLFVTCASPRLDGTRERPARIEGRLRVVPPGLPDTPTIREANLTVLHSAALAVVRRLGCVGDAGLPGAPVFRPAGGVHGMGAAP
ncbi:hypothetical protein AB6O49_12655 [Streptomyces sp. SBR177]